jgi:hypothetical protein
MGSPERFLTDLGVGRGVRSSPRGNETVPRKVTDNGGGVVGRCLLRAARLTGLRGGSRGSSRARIAPDGLQTRSRPRWAVRGRCGCGTLAATNRASIDRRSKPRAAVQRCVGSLVGRVPESGHDQGHDQDMDQDVDQDVNPLKLASPRVGANRCPETWLEARQIRDVGGCGVKASVGRQESQEGQVKGEQSLNFGYVRNRHLACAG